MKNCISIILALMLLINIEGNYLSYCILRFKIQNETWNKISKGINEKDLCVVIVPDNDKSGIIWLEKDKEFLYNWEMYDVVKLKTDKHHKIYYCINDRKEKQLINDYQKNHNSQKDSGKLLKNITHFEFVPQQAFSIKILVSKDIAFNMLIYNYKSLYINTISPPPKSL
jgi:hypothetical protein